MKDATASPKELRWTRIAIGLSAGVVIAAGLWFGFVRMVPSPPKAFPDKLTAQLLAPREQFGETVRKMTPHKDGKTPKELLIEYKNGATIIVNYAENGNPTDVKELLPLDPNEKERRVKAHIVLDPGASSQSGPGWPIIAASIYRKDRTLFLASRRISADLLETIEYAADGKKVEALHVFRRDEVQATTRFTADGAPLSFGRARAYGGFEEQTYRVDGTISHSVNKAGGRRTVDFYDSTGRKTMTASIDGDTVETTYLDEKGITTATRTFTSDRMIVTRYGPAPKVPTPAGKAKVAGNGAVAASPLVQQPADHVKLFKQEWDLKRSATSLESVYKLVSVEEFAPDGQTKRRLEFDGEGNVTGDTAGGAGGGPPATTKQAVPRFDGELLKQMPYEDPRVVMGIVNADGKLAESRAVPAPLGGFDLSSVLR